MSLFPSLLIALAALAGQRFAIDDSALAIVDVETTGLDPAHHEMVDLGAIYADRDGRELGRFFVRMTPDHPERAGEVARSINGFSEERWTRLGAVSEKEAIDRFLAFHRKQAAGKTMIFTAYNAHFDRAFLDALLEEHDAPRFADLYTYFLLDLPSFAWGAGSPQLFGDEVARAFGLAPETDDPLEHTGLTGAAWNLDLYRAIIARDPSNDRSR